MKFRIKVIEKPGAVSVVQPNGKTAEIGSTFVTDDLEWIAQRKHWHYLKISEATASTTQETIFEVKEKYSFGELEGLKKADLNQLSDAAALPLSLTSRMTKAEILEVFRLNSELGIWFLQNDVNNSGVEVDEEE